MVLTDMIQDKIIDTLYNEYGIIDVYFLKNELWVQHKIDIQGVEKCLTEMNLYVKIRHVEEDVVETC